MSTVVQALPTVSPVVPGTLVLVLVAAVMLVGRIIKTIAGAAKAIIVPLLGALAVLALIALVLVVAAFGPVGGNSEPGPRVADVVSPAVVLGR